MATIPHSNRAQLFLWSEWSWVSAMCGLSKGKQVSLLQSSLRVCSAFFQKESCFPNSTDHRALPTCLLSRRTPLSSLSLHSCSVTYLL